MKLRVFYKDLFAGILEQIKEQKGILYLFQYNPEYLQDKNARPISVNLPLQEEPFESDQLFPFFDNLLAEGWLLDVQAKTHRIDKNDRFALISVCGLECIGAVSLRGEQHDSLP